MASTERERTLVVALAKPVADHPVEGLSPVELAECVTRTLALPNIVRLGSSLDQPEQFDAL